MALRTCDGKRDRRFALALVAAVLALFMLLAAAVCPVHCASAATFSDVSSTAWYRPYVDYVSTKGLMTGYSGTT